MSKPDLSQNMKIVREPATSEPLRVMYRREVPWRLPWADETQMLIVTYVCD